MANTIFSPTELGRTRIRTLITQLETKLERLAKEKPNDELLSSWRELVSLLALGPEPETRACPSCGAIGMSDATSCAFCWAHLTPKSGTPASL